MSESSDLPTPESQGSPSMDEGIKMSVSKTGPQELASQLLAMRRNPAHFWVVGRPGCRWCPDEAEKSYQIAHVKSPDAGKWCSVHGWHYFQSNLIPPTEPIVRKRK